MYTASKLAARQLKRKPSHRDGDPRPYPTHSDRKP